MKIAQIIFISYLNTNNIKLDINTKSKDNRGKDGFGSTGLF